MLYEMKIRTQMWWKVFNFLIFISNFVKIFRKYKNIAIECPHLIIFNKIMFSYGFPIIHYYLLCQCQNFNLKKIKIKIIYIYICDEWNNIIIIKNK
jgi:hypothetical protein